VLGREPHFLPEGIAELVVLPVHVPERRGVVQRGGKNHEEQEAAKPDTSTTRVTGQAGSPRAEAMPHGAAGHH
jgi:hypothetical protein